MSELSVKRIIPLMIVVGKFPWSLKDLAVVFVSFI